MNSLRPSGCGGASGILGIAWAPFHSRADERMVRTCCFHRARPDRWTTGPAPTSTPWSLSTIPTPYYY